MQQIHFEESTHTYTRNNKKYTSCTTVTGMFKKPFDRRFWAMYSALKEKFNYYVRADESIGLIYVNNSPHGIDELYSVQMYRDACKLVRNGWDDITKKACDRGNKIHDYLEDTVNLSKDVKNTNDTIKPFTGKNTQIFKFKHDLDKTNLQEIYPEIYNTLLYYIDRGCTIYAEKKIFIDDYEIAGMIDCLIVKGKQFIILDWKTNKDIIHFRSGYYKKAKVNGKYIKTNEWVYKSQYLLSPLGHLEDCKGNLYTLQVSLYAFMMESWGYELINKGLMIYHIRPNERPELIKVPYLKQDVYEMLNYYKQNLRA